MIHMASGLVPRLQVDTSRLQSEQNHWTKLDTSEFLSDKVEKFTSNHFHSIPLDFCCVINEAILAMSSAMPSSWVLMESQ